MELAEPLEEGGVRGATKPALTDQGGTDETGGEAETDHDLDEDVVILEHLGHGVGRRHGTLQPIGIHIRRVESGFIDNPETNM